jgi:aldehyde:ferredoxin oxidoreductase
MLGTNYTTGQIADLGAEILRRERAFNEAAGLTAAHDRLPEFMSYEKLPPHNVVFDIPNETIDAVFGEIKLKEVAANA